jgi:hypothetical protein
MFAIWRNGAVYAERKQSGIVLARVDGVCRQEEKLSVMNEINLMCAARPSLISLAAHGSHDSNRVHQSPRRQLFVLVAELWYL